MAVSVGFIGVGNMGNPNMGNPMAGSGGSKALERIPRALIPRNFEPGFAVAQVPRGDPPMEDAEPGRPHRRV